MDADTRTKRLKEIDRLAKMMCEEAGCDLYETVTIKMGQDSTPIDHTSPVTMSPVQMQMGGGVYQIQQYTYDTYSVPRWRLFRAHACMALAYERAFDRYMLTEA